MSHDRASRPDDQVSDRMSVIFDKNEIVSFGFDPVGQQDKPKLIVTIVNNTISDKTHARGSFAAQWKPDACRSVNDIQCPGGGRARDYLPLRIMMQTCRVYP